MICKQALVRTMQIVSMLLLDISMTRTTSSPTNIDNRIETRTLKVLLLNGLTVPSPVDNP